MADSHASLKIPQSAELYIGARSPLRYSGVYLRENRTRCAGATDRAASLEGCRTWASGGTFKIVSAISPQ